MKKNLIFFILCSCCALPFAKGQGNDTVKAKSVHEFSADISAIYTPMVSQDFFGVAFAARYFLSRKFATGISIASASREITDTFSYSINQPDLNYLELGWLNQFDIFRKNKFRMNANLISGFSWTRLGDNSKNVKQYQPKNGYTYSSEEIATNNFYLLEPGMDISYRLFSSHSKWPVICLLAKAKYRFVFGDPKYSSTNQFSDYLFATGISIGNE